MNSADFIGNALKTEYVPTVLPVSRVSINAALGMAIACSEVMDILKKLIIYNKPIDLQKLSSQIAEMRASGDYLEATLSYPKDSKSAGCDNNDVNIRLLHAAIGMFTESGEMLNALRRQMNGYNLDKINVAEEIGDLQWYSAIAIDELGISEEAIRQMVIDKLAVRYPDKFTSQSAITRDLFAERKALEAGVRSC